MKKLRLNKNGKVLATVLTILLSIIIYKAMAQFGGQASEGTIQLILILSGWGWLMVGQFITYNFIWE